MGLRNIIGQFILQPLWVFLFLFLLFQADLGIYLFHQAQGQIHIICGAKPINQLKRENYFSPKQLEKIELIESVKQFAEDSLGFTRTKNFQNYFEQNGHPVLWVLTASEPYAVTEKTWYFPFLGNVSYKGHFEKQRGFPEYISLKKDGYDVSYEAVNAWSTLGWLSDPVLSSMLERQKPKLANLIFHELFHATYYKPGRVVENENLANFIAHYACIAYFKSDTATLADYYLRRYDDSLMNQFLLFKMHELDLLYVKISKKSTEQKVREKHQFLLNLYAEGTRLPFKNREKARQILLEPLLCSNAFFVDLNRYDAKFDSLKSILEAKYNGNLKNMIAGIRNGIR